MQLNNLGIDLGTSMVRIAVPEQGVVLSEPSVMAINKKDGTIIAVGNEAYEMMEHEPPSIQIVRPMQKGVISDYDCVEKMLYLLVKKVCSRRVFKPKAAISIPATVTEVEERSLVQVSAAVGVRKTLLVQSYIAASLGAGANIIRPHGHMVVDLGAGKTEIGAISIGGPAAFTSVRVGGDNMDEAIIRGVHNQYNFVIGKKTAEQIKIQIGSAMKTEGSLTIKGRDLVSGLPCEKEIRASDVYEYIEDSLFVIRNAIQTVLEKTPPEMASDIMADGIILTGGLAKLNQLPAYLESELGVPFQVTDNPENCVAIGTCDAISHRKERLDIIDVNVFNYNHSNWVEI